MDGAERRGGEGQDDGEKRREKGVYVVGRCNFGGSDTCQGEGLRTWFPAWW